MTCLNRIEYGRIDVLSPVGPEGNEWGASNFCFFRYFLNPATIVWGFPGGTSGKKKSACQGRRHKRLRFYPWFGTIPWSMKWYPTSVFLPGKFHGQRSLVDYSPWGHRVRHGWTHTHTHHGMRKPTLSIRPSWRGRCRETRLWFSLWD